MLGIRPSTFYRWYDRYRTGGPEALEDKPSRPDRVWNRIPDEVRDRISSWRWACRTCRHGSWPPDLQAADEFKDKTTAPNQLWQTDFTYLTR